MRIIPAEYEIMSPIDGAEILKFIEKIARTCYQSEVKIEDNSAPEMVRRLIDRGHLAMIEHMSFTVKFIVDRGVSHELVRHRLASFAQESTRFCNYSLDKYGNDVTFIRPFFWEEDSEKYQLWQEACEVAESAYLKLLSWGATPQEARAVLPNSLKTEIVMTMNLREWRHFFSLRACDATGPAHPQMKEVTVPLLRDIKKMIPIIFDDLEA